MAELPLDKLGSKNGKRGFGWLRLLGDFFSVEPGELAGSIDGGRHSVIFERQRLAVATLWFHAQEGPLRTRGYNFIFWIQTTGCPNIFGQDTTLNVLVKNPGNSKSIT